jgi:hypothetical protein
MTSGDGDQIESVGHAVRLEGLEAMKADPAGTAAARSRGAITIERPALERRLDDAFGKRVTLVVAGAGFGKTTLLASWAADLAAVWYQARERIEGSSRSRAAFSPR